MLDINGAEPARRMRQDGIRAGLVMLTGRIDSPIDSDITVCSFRRENVYALGYRASQESPPRLPPALDFCLAFAQLKARKSAPLPYQLWIISATPLAGAKLG